MGVRKFGDRLEFEGRVTPISTNLQIVPRRCRAASECTDLGNG